MNGKGDIVWKLTIFSFYLIFFWQIPGNQAQVSLLSKLYKGITACEQRSYKEISVNSLRILVGNETRIWADLTWVFVGFSSNAPYPLDKLLSLYKSCKRESLCVNFCDFLSGLLFGFDLWFLICWKEGSLLKLLWRRSIWGRFLWESGIIEDFLKERSWGSEVGFCI